MVLKLGESILVVHRRLFEGDDPRLFVGRVEAYEAGVLRATGHSYLRDRITGRLQEKAEDHTKLLSLSSGTLMVYALSDSIDLASVRFVSDGMRLWLADDKGTRMDLAEFTLGNRRARAGLGPRPGSAAEEDHLEAGPPAGKPAESVVTGMGVGYLIALALALAGAACVGIMYAGGIELAAECVRSNTPIVWNEVYKRVGESWGWGAVGAALAAAGFVMWRIAPRLRR